MTCICREESCAARFCQAIRRRRQRKNFPTRFETEEEKLAFISRMKSRAYYDTGTEAGVGRSPGDTGHLYGNGYTHRWVVQAKVTEEIRMTEEAGH